jgi:hypothetical protein
MTRLFCSHARINAVIHAWALCIPEKDPSPSQWSMAQFIWSTHHHDNHLILSFNLSPSTSCLLYIWVHHHQPRAGCACDLGLRDFGRRAWRADSNLVAAAGETGMLLSSTVPFCPWASEVFFDLVGLGEERTWVHDTSEHLMEALRRESVATAGETGMLLSSTVPFCPWASDHLMWLGSWFRPCCSARIVHGSRSAGRHQWDGYAAFLSRSLLFVSA